MSALAWGSWMGPLLDHLWQSTMFAGGVWVLALALRRNAARVRFRLWMAASLKFLVPFSLLMALGARLPWPADFSRTQPAVAAAVEGVAQPLLQAWPVEMDTGLAARAASGAGHSATDWLPWALMALWAAGTLLLLGRWTASWLRLRAAVRRGEAVTLADGTRARVVAENVEPGVFGIMRPVLVLPRGIAERLSAEQMDAIVEHEICHMRRRDNLTAALHMAVEAVFWFCPPVWWLGTRLVEERERACDEAVLEVKRRPLIYAEGILNVCKFYVEAPLSCVAGVTGSELKQRIARILSGEAVRKLDARRKALVAVACVLAVGVPVTAGVVRAAQGQTAAGAATVSGSSAGSGSIGTWQGTMRTPDGHDFRLVLKITSNEKGGGLGGTMYSLSQNGAPITGNSVSFESGTLRFVNQFYGITYEGKISADGNSISGTYTQNGSYPLVFEKATPFTEWTIPAPPHLPAMAANASPGVEVATIKPSPPNAPRTMLTLRGSELVIERMSLNDLIEYAWVIHNKQVAGTSGWMSTGKWDIEAKPDTPGVPNSDQIREMVQKLLEERFALKFHQEKREMAAYVLTVDRDGPKMAKGSDPSARAGYSVGPGGLIRMRDATMGDFAGVLTRTTLDRPVLDRTGLQGRWNFELKWLWDESQFAGQVPPPPPGDPATSLPPLFTAIQEQLGLKLEARKMDVPVMVIDHVEQPSAN